MKKNQKLTALISALNLQKYDKIPEGEGWFTTNQLSREMNLSIGTVSKKLRKGQDEGTIECKKFAVDRNGAARIVPHFRKK
jgi:predicted transcriptional regulator